MSSAAEFDPGYVFDPAIATTDAYTTMWANYQAFLAKQIGVGQGWFSSWDGTVATIQQFLNPDEQADLLNASVKWMKDHPTQFPGRGQQVATLTANPAQHQIENNALTQASDFVSEVGNNAVNLASAIQDWNPLNPKNFKYVAMIAAGIVVLYIFKDNIAKGVGSAVAKGAKKVIPA